MPSAQQKVGQVCDVVQTGLAKRRRECQTMPMMVATSLMLPRWLQVTFDLARNSSINRTPML